MGQKYEIMCYFAYEMDRIFEKTTAMNLELEIARRMAHAAEGRRPSVMERIATLAVALSLAVMLVAMAVMWGFKREIGAKFSLLAADVVVTDVANLHTIEHRPIRSTTHLDSLLAAVADGERITRYARRGAVLRTAEGVEGVVLKGVARADDLAPYAAWLRSGQLPSVGDSIRSKGVLISEKLAATHALEAGDRIELLFIESDALPYRDRYEVAGVYHSGMEELDRMLLLTDLRNVQRAALWDEPLISGYEIRLRDADRAPQLAAALDEALLYDEAAESENLVAQSVQASYPQIFDWLKVHDVNTAVVIVVMLFVALFNMSTALLVVVLERIRMIGILKALGMQNRALRRLFRYRATMIALKGLVWGNVVGLALCALQYYFALVPLDAEGYLLASVPIAMRWGGWLLLNAGFAVTIFVLMLLPASVVATIRPDETMRYE